MLKFQYKKQKGFSILAILLISIAIIGAIAAWSLSSQSNISDSKNITLQASSIIEDSQAIKIAYDSLLYQGANVSNIVFVPKQSSTVNSPNILDPNNGVVLSAISKEVIRTGASAPEGIWVYNPTGFKGRSVGTLTSDPVILLAGIKDTVCLEINRSLYNITTRAAYPSLDSLSLVSDATISYPMSTKEFNLNNMMYGFSPAGWTMGCIFTMEASDNNIFFRILKVM